MKRALRIVLITLAVVLVIALVIRKREQDPYRDFIAHHKPWQEYVNTKNAIYLKDDHVMISYDSETEKYWTSDLNRFYDVFYDKVLRCKEKNRMTPCSPIDSIKNVYGVFSATFSTKENELSVTFINHATENTAEPELYTLSSTLDGENIHVAE